MNPIINLYDRIYKRIGSTIYYHYPRWRKYMPDKMYLQCIWRDTMGYELDFRHPKTFCEKLQWLKIYNRKPVYTKMVDKATAKEYVASIIGEKYIIPTLGIYNNFDEIDFDTLPNQFVLKATHNSGGVYICKDKSQIDLVKARSMTEGQFGINVYNDYKEWPYKNVKPRIIAEKYMEENDGVELKDYKFFCFGGEVKALLLISDRFKANSETCFDFYDRDFRHQDVITGPPMSLIPHTKPQCYDEMICIAEKLSKDIPFVRVDLYQTNGKVYFGEMTFFPVAGMIHFKPFKWDYVFGEWLNLEKKY